MSHDPGLRHQVPPETWRDTEDQLRKITLALRHLMIGGANTTFRVTLRPNETETDIPFSHSTTVSVPQVTPLSPGGAAALASGAIWIEPLEGMIRVHHDSDPASDRTLGLVFFG